MKTIIIALLFLGCSVTNEPNFNKDFETLNGYISNELQNPFIFTTSDTLIYIYNYNNYKFENVRVKRDIMVEHRDNRFYFISELNNR